MNNQCEKCNVGVMVLRRGKNGEFLGCSNYPECNNTKSVKSESSDAKSGRHAGDSEKGEPPSSISSRDRLIVRQVALKAAVELYSHLGAPANKSFITELAEEFERWVLRE